MYKFYYKIKCERKWVIDFNFHDEKKNYVYCKIN